MVTQTDVTLSTRTSKKAKSYGREISSYDKTFKACDAQLSTLNDPWIDGTHENVFHDDGLNCELRHLWDADTESGQTPADFVIEWLSKTDVRRRKEFVKLVIAVDKKSDGQN